VGSNELICVKFLKTRVAPDEDEGGVFNFNLSPVGDAKDGNDEDNEGP